MMPALSRVERLRRRLGGCEVKAFAPLPERIRRGRGGHSRAFHEALVAMIQIEEAKLVAYLGSIVYDLNRRLRGCRGKRHDPAKAKPRPDTASS
jgi:hypothetical protein